MHWLLIFFINPAIILSFLNFLGLLPPNVLKHCWIFFQSSLKCWVTWTQSGFIVRQQNHQKKKYSGLESPKCNVMTCSNCLRVVRIIECWWPSIYFETQGQKLLTGLIPGKAEIVSSWIVWLLAFPALASVCKCSSRLWK